MTRRRIDLGEAGDEALLPRRRRSDTGLDITPMIDVTFLLLIFFMVVSTMSPAPDLDVPPARHGVGVETRAATVVTVRRPGVGAEPLILLGDGKGPTGDLDDVRRYVEERRAAGHMRVIIKADREIPHGFVQRVAREVHAVEGVEFYIGVRDKPR